MLPPVTWTDESEEHIAKHNVQPEEVEEALYSRPRYQTVGREETVLVYGQTNADRYLLIVTVGALDGGHLHRDRA